MNTGTAKTQLLQVGTKQSATESRPEIIRSTKPKFGHFFFFHLSSMASLRYKITYSEVSSEMDEASRRYWNAKITVFYPSKP